MSDSPENRNYVIQGDPANWTPQLREHLENMGAFGEPVPGNPDTVTVFTDLPDNEHTRAQAALRVTRGKDDPAVVVYPVDRDRVAHRR